MIESLTELRNKEKQKQKELDDIRKEISIRLSKTIVKCPKAECSKGFEIRELDYIQTQWYVSPHGCTGGDYWKDGEGQWKCPSCGAVTRLYNKPDLVELKYHFKSIIKTQDR